MLSGEEIIRQRKGGNIVIEPFFQSQVQPNSYDFRIGKWIARFVDFDIKPFDLDDTYLRDLYTIEECKYDIFIRSGERILCHTEEFFGSYAFSVPCLATRSTIARLGMDVCGSAGFGDIGYINRWTLELQNNSPHHYRIPVGTRVGQVYFNETNRSIAERSMRPTDDIDLLNLNYAGQYKLPSPRSRDFDGFMEKWEPEMMIPKEIIDERERTIHIPRRSE